MRSAEDKRALLKLRQGAEWALDTQLLPFWKGLRDDECGGFYGRTDFELNLYKTADKGVILHSRILYFFSEYAHISGDLRYISEAEHAYDFLMQNCFDREHGGVYWSVTYDGKLSDTTKYAYVQAFAIYALCSFYDLTGNRNALDKAIDLFQLLENRFFDGIGYTEAFDRNWGNISNERLSENNVIASRTMNTILHIFEAYTSLYKLTRTPDVRAAMVRILNIYSENVYNSAKKRQEVFFDMDYNSLIDLQSYGHDIESSWLIDIGADELDDAALTERIYRIDSELAEQVYNKAFVQDSIINECENGCDDTDRIWWVQCEAVIGFVNLWQKTDDQKYLKAAEKIWCYIQAHIVDKRDKSEWFWGVHPDFTPMTDKDIAGEWKCPYHNGRMCFEIIRRSYENS